MILNFIHLHLFAVSAFNDSCSIFYFDDIYVLFFRAAVIRGCVQFCGADLYLYGFFIIL